MFRLSLAVVILYLAHVADAANCAVPADPTNGKKGAGAGSCGVALAENTPVPGRCTAACDASAGYVAKGPASYGQTVSDATQTAQVANPGLGGQGTCLTTTTFTMVTCEGSNKFTVGYSATTPTLLAANNSDYATNKGLMLNCAVAASIDATWCRIASVEKVVVKQGVAFGCTIGTNANNKSPITCTFEVSNSVMSQADLTTKITAWAAGPGALMQASLTALKATATTSPFTGTEAVGTAATVAATANKNVAIITTMLSLNSNDVAALVTTGTQAFVHKACNASAAPANGAVGTGTTVCTGWMAKASQCQPTCNTGFMPLGGAGGEVVSTAPAGEVVVGTNGAVTPASGSGGTSVCHATSGALVAATCDYATKYTQEITVATSIVANKADYDTDNTKIKQLSWECAYAKTLDATWCTVTTNTASTKFKNGFAISSVYSATGTKITFTISIAKSLATASVVATNVAKVTAANVKLAYDAVKTQVADNKFDGGGITSGGITAVATVSYTTKYCSAVAPTNGALGSCTAVMGGGTSCTPTCNAGYTAAASMSCSATGVFTPATCNTTSNNNVSTPVSTTTSTVTQDYTFASLAAADYSGSVKGNIQCAYANTVEGGTSWCKAALGPTWTYMNGVSVESSAVSARRAAKVTFILVVSTSIKTLAQIKLMVASNSNAGNFASALTAVNTASNFTASPGEATVSTATFSSTGSGASTLLPSILSLVAVIFVVARH